MTKNEKIIYLKEKEDWNRIVSNMLQFDFYFTYSYNSLSVTEQDIPFLYFYQESDYKIIFPLILRRIPDCDCYDATSVYGYAGPLASHLSVPNKILENFHIGLAQYFTRNNIISVFSRLHPYIQNEKYLSGIGDITTLSNTVFIDLQTNTDAQYKQYRKGVKSDLSKLKREGFEVFEDTKLTHLSKFIEIYNENMCRVNADQHYFFPESYYQSFFESKEIGARLFFVKKDNDFVASSIFTFVNGIIQYHLSGTSSEFLKNSPTRLLIDHVRLLGVNLNYKILHLGGGVGSKNDSLFNYKTGFSKSFLDFKTWKYIVDYKKYNDLVFKYKIVGNHNYFPLYRVNDRRL